MDKQTELERGYDMWCDDLITQEQWEEIKSNHADPEDV